MNKRNIERELIDALRARGWRMAAAESCTGGRIAQRITAVPGASDVFSGSMVSYSCETKQSALGVRAETLDKYGAVSEKTAREMALGALQITEADVAVSPTGVAGPGGGTADCPVGTVCFGLALRASGEVSSVRVQFDPSAEREAICGMAATYAMELVMDALRGE